jgi:uncharacterized protein YkwD
VATARVIDGGSGLGWRRWRSAPAVACLVGVLGLVACGGGAPVVLAPGGAGTLTSTSVGEEAWAIQVLELTNAVRAEHGLAPLTLDARASAAAYEHSWDMDLRDFFAHENPDGEDPVDRLARHGVVRPWVGENLARGFESPEEVVQGWLDSPTHRENLLYPGWTHVGIAVHTAPSGGPWWTADYFAGE